MQKVQQQQEAISQTLGTLSTRLGNVLTGKVKLVKARVGCFGVPNEGVWTLSPQGLGTGNARLMQV